MTAAVWGADKSEVSVYCWGGRSHIKDPSASHSHSMAKPFLGQAQGTGKASFRSMCRF